MFMAIENGHLEKRYAVTGASLEVEPAYFVGLHKITSRDSQKRKHTNDVYGPDLDIPPTGKNKKRLWGATDSGAVFTGPSTMLPVLHMGHVAKNCWYDPRCFHCEETTKCPRQLETESPSDNSRIEQVKSAQFRLGATPNPKATLVTTLPHTSNPLTKKTMLAAKTIASDYSRTTVFPDLPSVKLVKPTTTTTSPPNTPPTN